MCLPKKLAFVLLLVNAMFRSVRIDYPEEFYPNFGCETLKRAPIPFRDFSLLAVLSQRGVNQHTLNHYEDFQRTGDDILLGVTLARTPGSRQE